jgi:YebC/PmpR family DNA-binding regulatory protein
MSGHNKWSKIKHKKAATDSQRSKLFSKHSSLITMESKKANGDIASAGLAAAIERAKKDSMPKENIERAVAKGSGADGLLLQEVLFETFGPGGVAMLITAVTDNNNRTSQEIKHTLSRLGYQLGGPGSSVWAFSKTHTGYTPLQHVELTDEAIEAIEEQADVQEIYTSADEPVPAA